MKSARRAAVYLAQTGRGKMTARQRRRFQRKIRPEQDALIDEALAQVWDEIEHDRG